MGLDIQKDTGVRLNTKDLYTAAEVKAVRQLLLKEQQGLCALSKIKVALQDTHCDHAHDDLQLVRGVLHRHANMTLGKLEGLWNRYLSHWYPHDFPTFLRQSADYLEKPQDNRFRHPGWLKRLKVSYNRLNAFQQNSVLVGLGYPKGSNPSQRKALFNSICLDRNNGYDLIKVEINKVKEIS